MLDQQPPQALPPTAKALAALLAQITALSAGLSPCYQLLYRTPLSTTQRKSLGSMLPKDPRALVRATAYALQGTDQDHAPLFADLAVSARTLGLSQEVASALQLLGHHFGLLHLLCKDALLSAQAGAVELAREAITAIEQEQTRSPRDLHHKLRRLAMATPVSLDPSRKDRALKSARSSSRTMETTPHTQGKEGTP